MSVVSLAPKPTVDDEVKQSAIDLLEWALALAKEGQVDGVVMIVSHPDGSWTDNSSKTVNLSTQIGRIEILKQNWIVRYNEERNGG